MGAVDNSTQARWPFTLVLIPGLVNTARVWSAQLPGLSARVHTCVAEHQKGARSLATMASVVLEQVSGPLALAGHSMGGRIALEVARQAPERIVGLALLDTGYCSLPEGPAGSSEIVRRLALVELARRQGMRAMLQEWIRGMVAPARLADCELVEGVIGMMATNSADDFAAQVDALIHRPDASDVLTRFRGPALVLCGAEDAWAPPAQHVALAELLADAECHVLADCGHMAPMERPEETLAHLLDWIQRLGV